MTATEVAVAADGVWAISSLNKAVVRIDPTTRTVTGRIDGVDAPTVIDASAGVWVGTATSVLHIDPLSLTIVGTTPADLGRGGGIVIDGSDLWIRGMPHFLVRIDTTTGEELDRFEQAAISGGNVLIAFGAVWASASDDALVVRHQLAESR